MLMGQPVAITSPYQQLYFNAFKLEFEGGSGPCPQGTGFLFEFNIYDNGGIICLITAGHCVPPTGKVRFSLPVRVGSEHVDVRRQVFFDLAAADFVRHPNPDIDLAIAMLGPQIKAHVAKGIHPYPQTWSLDGVHTPDELGVLDWVEDVYFMGCPSGWYDDVNFLPVVRRATTATPLQVDYKGRPEFLIDAHVFKGSSGSPVVLVDQKRDWIETNPKENWQGRTALLGILVRGAEDRLGTEIGLGECVRAEMLLDFIPLLIRLGGIENLKPKWMNKLENHNG